MAADLGVEGSLDTGIEAAAAAEPAEAALLHTAVTDRRWVEAVEVNKIPQEGMLVVGIRNQDTLAVAVVAGEGRTAVVEVDHRDSALVGYMKAAAEVAAVEEHWE